MHNCLKNGTPEEADGDNLDGDEETTVVDGAEDNAVEEGEEAADEDDDEEEEDGEVQFEEENFWAKSFSVSGSKCGHLNVK